MMGKARSTARGGRHSSTSQRTTSWPRQRMEVVGVRQPESGLSRLTNWLDLAVILVEIALDYVDLELR